MATAAASLLLPPPAAPPPGRLSARLPVAARLRATGRGVVVLTEAFWPGDFRAEVDGLSAPVLRLNHAFKGVLIEAAGDHRVTFRYVPRHFSRNLLLCGVGAVLLGVSLYLVLRPAKELRRSTADLAG